MKINLNLKAKYQLIISSQRKKSRYVAEKLLEGASLLGLKRGILVA